MKVTWPIKRLCDLADIRVSNVDKKVQANEKPIKLCNYMDVYLNEYVSNKIQYMKGSASVSEIERFGLDYGDVIITKDSETPDDIGIPTVVVETVPDLVCGYHLALIRPNLEQLDPIYLAKQLSTSYVARYFATRASGSTRYGLPKSAIESIEVPVPPKPEQTKIAEILSTVDRAIEQTEALIAKHQRIKTGLMQDLLTRGIDEHGNLRSEETHQFKDSPLGRIPAEWEVLSLSELARVERGKFTYRPRNDPRFYGGEYPFIQTGDITSNVGRKVVSYTQSLNERGARVSKEFPKDTVAITIAANIADTAILGMAMFFPDSIVGVIVEKPNEVRYVELVLRKWKPALEALAPQSAQKNINLEVLKPLPIPCPNPDEQRRIGSLHDVLDSDQGCMERSLCKLRSLKTSLMQDLLTGKVRVTPLLDGTEVMSE